MGTTMLGWSVGQIALFGVESLIARSLQRPYSVIYGNSDYTTSDLIGGNFGYRRKKKVDNFIHNVYTVEEDFQLKWFDKQLTTACREGMF